MQLKLQNNTCAFISVTLSSVSKPPKALSLSAGLVEHHGFMGCPTADWNEELSHFWEFEFYIKK